MFEVGKRYEFVCLSSSEDGLYESSDSWIVTAVEGNLLHLHRPAIEESQYLAGGSLPAQDMVLNTASAFFHSAQLASDD